MSWKKFRTPSSSISSTFYFSAINLLKNPSMSYMLFMLLLSLPVLFLPLKFLLPTGGMLSKLLSLWLWGSSSSESLSSFFFGFCCFWKSETNLLYRSFDWFYLFFLNIFRFSLLLFFNFSSNFSIKSCVIILFYSSLMCLCCSIL